MWRVLIGLERAGRIPGPVAVGQLAAGGISAKGVQARAGLGFEHVDLHGKEPFMGGEREAVRVVLGHTLGRRAAKAYD